MGVRVKPELGVGVRVGVRLAVSVAETGTVRVAVGVVVATGVGGGVGVRSTGVAECVGVAEAASVGVSLTRVVDVGDGVGSNAAPPPPPPPLHAAQAKISTAKQTWQTPVVQLHPLGMLRCVSPRQQWKSRILASPLSGPQQTRGERNSFACKANDAFEPLATKGSR